MCKPFDALELLARVERTIRRSREGLAANPLTGLPGGWRWKRKFVGAWREKCRFRWRGWTWRVGRIQHGLRV
jgi:DNA-binding response OmpR family regulator